MSKSCWLDKLGGSHITEHTKYHKLWKNNLYDKLYIYQVHQGSIRCMYCENNIPTVISNLYQSGRTISQLKTILLCLMRNSITAVLHLVFSVTQITVSQNDAALQYEKRCLTCVKSCHFNIQNKMFNTKDMVQVVVLKSNPQSDCATHVVIKTRLDSHRSNILTEI